jgi:hypothetical protein
VLALRGPNPALGFRELFARPLHVGPDHVSATVNTLVPAYVGASLPVLLIFSSAELEIAEALKLDLVARRWWRPWWDRSAWHCRAGDDRAGGTPLARADPEGLARWSRAPRLPE